jgi:hypothetical protein
VSPTQWWHGACNPASPDLLEQGAGYVRLITTQSPVTAVASDGCRLTRDFPPL